MARAYSIHIIEYRDCYGENSVVAAFTVKQECKNWLNKQEDLYIYDVITVADGSNRIIHDYERADEWVKKY